MLGRFLKPGNVFVDIGANVGVFSMKAAKEVGDAGTVIAIEPFIESACQLSRNIAMNKYRNCRVRNFCVGRTTGHIRFFMNSNKPNSFSLTQSADSPSISVLCVSLNDLCMWEGIERLDYLKIDAEGAEDMILEGGAEMIARFRPVIQLEILMVSPHLPLEYCRFSAPGSSNHVFIPSERVDAIETAKALSWTEIF